LLKQFSVSLVGAEDAVREGIAQTMACLAPLELGEDEAGTVQLVLAEALNNVVEHALAGTRGMTLVEIRGSIGDHFLELVVIDEGSAMQEGHAPRPNAPDVGGDMADLPEGGFGWFLINTLAQDIRYERRGEFNHLSLRLPISH
jgi:serine/threonine-protein kinase RsbW